MFETIINAVKESLGEWGFAPVYSAFDNVPAERRSKGFFTVVDICSFESSAPIYSPYTVYIPYMAETEIRVTAPESCSMTEIYRYCDRFIGEAVAGLSGMNGSIKGMTVKYDSNICRLVHHNSKPLSRGFCGGLAEVADAPDSKSDDFGRMKIFSMIFPFSEVVKVREGKDALRTALTMSLLTTFVMAK